MGFHRNHLRVPATKTGVDWLHKGMKITVGRFKLPAAIDSEAEDAH
jgi:hypothetical protein